MPLGESLPSSTTDSAVYGRADQFTPALCAALQQDAAAQRASAEIVSVLGDYDPFVMSQDPCPRYEARTATVRPTGVEVAVYSQCSPVTRVAVLVDVVRDGATWRFADFRRPEAPTVRLPDALEAARAQRDQAPSVERFTVRLQRDVPVVRGGGVRDRLGVLYGDTAMVLPRGTVLSSSDDEGEGSCHVDVGTRRHALRSCPWLPGFRDHQADIFRVERTSRRVPR